MYDYFVQTSIGSEINIFQFSFFTVCQISISSFADYPNVVW